MNLKLNVTKEDLGNCQVKLGIVIDPSSVEETYSAVLKDIAKEAKHPGFRKGKVPMDVVEKKYSDAIAEEIVSRIVPESVYEAVQKEKIVPITRPRIEKKVEFIRGKEIAFEASFEIRPEVSLKEYKGIKVTKTVEPVTDEKIEQTLNNLREHHAQFVPAENRSAQLQDSALIDFDGSIDGEPLPGGKGENYPLLLGSGKFIPGFEENVVGMSIDEQKEFKVTFPEDYHAEDLQGKEVTFKVTLKGLKERSLPALDDEFAKDMGEFATLDDLKADIKNELTKVNENRAEDDVKDQIAEALINAHDAMIVPNALIEDEISRRLHQLEQNLQRMGRTLEDYLKEENKTTESLREDIRAAARKTVIYHLVSDEIAKTEKMEPTEDDVQDEINRLAAAARMEPAEYRSLLEKHDQLDVVRDQVRMDKTMKFLIAQAAVKEK